MTNARWTKSDGPTPQMGIGETVIAVGHVVHGTDFYGLTADESQKARAWGGSAQATSSRIQWTFIKSTEEIAALEAAEDRKIRVAAKRQDHVEALVRFRDTLADLERQKAYKSSKKEVLRNWARAKAGDFFWSTSGRKAALRVNLGWARA